MQEAIETLLAIETIQTLKARYFRLLDARDFTAWGKLFCEDAVFDCTDAMRVRQMDGTWLGKIGPILVGRDAIVTSIYEVFRDRVSLHLGHSHEITILNAVQAEGVIAMRDSICDLSRQKKLVEGAGHYHERYRKEGNIWLIEESRLVRSSRELFA